MTVEVHLLTNMVTHTTTSLNNGRLKFVEKKKKKIIANLRHFHVQLLQYPLYCISMVPLRWIACKQIIHTFMLHVNTVLQKQK